MQLFVKLYSVLSLLLDAVIVILVKGNDFRWFDIWLPIVLFFGLFIAFFAAHIIFCVVVSLVSDNEKPREKPSKFFKFWTDQTVLMVLTLLRIKVKINGIEKIPTDRRFLLVSNHRSSFDPMLCMAHLSKYNIAFVSKPENFRLPAAPAFMNRCCFLPIDRDNARNAMRTLHRATDYIKNDIVSIGIYPEGKRSKTCELLEFKDGVFYVAKKSECPIVVMAVKNTENITKNLFIRKTVAQLEIIDVIEAEDYKNSTTHDISEKVRTELLEYLGG